MMTAREKKQSWSLIWSSEAPLLSNRRHSLRSSCKECFISKWKSKHEGETILRLRQKWQCWKTSCSAVSEGKKPDSRVVQLSEHLSLSELLSVVIYSRLTSISELYHFSSSSISTILARMMCALMLCRVIQEMESLLLSNPHKQCSPFPTLYQVPLALPNLLLWHISEKKQSKEGRFLPDNPWYDSALWWRH